MLRRRVIPCLDCRDGRVVKGVQFQGLRDVGDPAELAARYEAEGADELTLLDVSATPDGRANATATVRAVRRALSIPLTVGGGVRSVEDAARLLDAGADKVGVNTAAVRDPDLITRIATRFGAQCCVLAIDAAIDPAIGTESGRWQVVVTSGRERLALDAVEWASRGVSCGAGEILLTSWDRDGTRSGYDIALIRGVCQCVTTPVIASGGASSPEHMLDALENGAQAVLAASIFHDAQYSINTVKRWLAARGMPMRIEAEKQA